MEAVSPQLAQAVAAARVALTEAFVLKVGQVLQAVVAGKSADGLTLLKIGDQMVKAALPEGLPPGTTLQLQVKSAGPAPQLAILTQTPPQGRQAGPAATTPAPATPAPMPPAAPAPVHEARPQIGESRPAFVPVTSQTESMPQVGVAAAQQARPPGPVVAAAASQGPAAESATSAPAPPGPPQAAAAPTVVRPASVATASATVEPMGEPAIAPAAVPIAAGDREVVGRPQAATTVSPPATEPQSAPAAATPPTVTQASQSQVASTVKSAAVAQGAPTSASSPSALPTEPDLVHPLLVAQAAPRPQATVAEVPRPSVAPIPPPATQPPLPTTPRAALSQMLPEALAKQDSAGPLLQSLATLVQKPGALPEPVLRTALAVLTQRIVVTNGKLPPAELERAVLRSGLGLEASLARGEAPVPLDAKAGLLALRAALVKWLGDAPPPVAQREAPPPPLKGLPPRAPDSVPPPLPDGPRDVLRALHGQADAAVSRLKLMQMASLPDPDPGRPAAPALRLELPLLIGHELVMAQLQVSRDGSRREAERKRGWTMRFALNFSATGEVGAEVGLLGKAVNVALWAAEPETAEAMQAALPELAGALEAVGLRPGALRIRRGAPEPERPASGQLLDSTS